MSLMREYFPDKVDEEARRRFEIALTSGSPVLLEDYLPDVESSTYLPTLEEFVSITLEHSWQRWSVSKPDERPLPLEHYLSRFPVLAESEIRTRLSQLEKQLQGIASEFEATTSSRMLSESHATPVSRSKSVHNRTSLLAPPVSQLGHYRLLEPIGRGGMGVVYRGFHTRLHKHVAIKLLPADSWNDASTLQRFQREMRAAGQVQHPNIVVTHDAGEANGLYYLVMELVEGENLDAVASRQRQLPIAEACAIVQQAALGIHHAHTRQLVHRDIKPSNLMLNHEGVVKVLDLGLARLHTSRSDVHELTDSNQFMGTFHYMAPEQAEDAHRVGASADVYSLGATLYRFLGGQPPLGPPGMSALQMLSAIAKGEVVPIRNLRPDCPEELEMLLKRMLSRIPAERPATAGEVANLLTPFATGADLRRMLQSSSTMQEPDYPGALPQPQDSLKNTAMFRHEPWAGGDSTPKPDMLGVEAIHDLPMQRRLLAERMVIGPAVPASTIPDNPSSLRSGGWWSRRWLPVAALTTVLGLVGVLAMTALSSYWTTSPNPSVLVIDFPRTYMPQVSIDGQPISSAVVEQGRFQVLVSPGKKRLTVRGVDGATWYCDAANDTIVLEEGGELALHAWPLLPEQEIVNWVLSQKGYLRTLNAAGEEEFVSSADLQLAETRQEIVQVSLAGTSVADDDLWRLSSLSQLKELDLSATAISDSGLHFLTPLHQLFQLNLVDTGISDEGLSHLSRLPELRQLYLSRTEIGDSRLHLLRPLNLMELTLDGTRVTSQGLASLAGFSELRQLNLMDLMIPAIDLEKLRSQLPNCEILPRAENTLHGGTSVTQ